MDVLFHRRLEREARERGRWILGERKEGEIIITQNDRAPASTEELLVTGLAQIDALVKVFIAKGIIMQQEFLQKTAEGRAT